MYKVLYRKWRPQKFADVVGQPQVTVTLKNELTAGRIAHAYLFTGSRGTGKTTCAKILAKAVNCLHPVEGDPCGECEICRGVENGSVMDIVEIDAASNNGVENIRSLREEANFTPAAAQYRVYIIDEVHMLSIGAFNALLKTLEEPPEHVVFILATTEVHKLPATILSRCQRFDFRRIPAEEIAARLAYVAGREGGELEEQAGLQIARLADGALRDALSLLDQCLGRGRQITLDIVNETAGLVGRDHLFGLAEAIREKDSLTALETIDSLHHASKDMARLCEELSSHFRALMLIKTMKNARGLLAVTDGEMSRLTEQAVSTGLPEILHCLDSFQQALERMYRGGDRRIELEMTLIRLCTPELDAGPAALIRRVEALERAVRSGMRPAPQKVGAAEGEERRLCAEPDAEIPPPEEELREVPPPPAFPAPDPVPASAAHAASSMERLQASAVRLEEWPEILRILKEYSAAIAAAFAGSSAYVSENYVLIDAPKEMAFELLRKSSQRVKMREAIQQVTGKVYKLGPYRPPEAETQEAEDPLLVLASRAEQAGVEVVLE